MTGGFGVDNNQVIAALPGQRMSEQQQDQNSLLLVNINVASLIRLRLALIEKNNEAGLLASHRILCLFITTFFDRDFL